MYDVTVIVFEKATSYAKLDYLLTSRSSVSAKESVIFGLILNDQIILCQN